MALEPFSQLHPDRFFNMGVAEQNMLGVATGLAEAGYKPFAYSIVTFASLRPFEFLRNGGVLHDVPVRVVGVGGGFEYGHAGPTHYGLEDIGVMRTLNGLTVIAPADSAQARTAFLETYDLPGPVYYRIGKNDRLVVPGLDGKFELGRAQVCREGSDILFISMGSIAAETSDAIAALAEEGIDAGHVVVASLSPAPIDDLVELLNRYPVAITVEAHSVQGGIGSLVSEIIAENGIDCQIHRAGVRTPMNGRSGSETHMHSVHGLDANTLAASARTMIGKAIA
jgi:transketolase